MRRIHRREAIRDIAAIAATGYFSARGQKAAAMLEDTAQSWNHQYTEANGIRIHYVRQGFGHPIILLHGWPEFWWTWHKNIPGLAKHFDVVAPDLRGFGDTTKPSGILQDVYAPNVVVEDLRGLVDALGFERVGIASHDLGAVVAQIFARQYPERVSRLFFFNIPYPGIGLRWAEPDQVKEVWYQNFHQLPWSADVVGATRHSCELYVRHFLEHWSHDPSSFAEGWEPWVDNFMKEGNLQGGFNWYISFGAARPPKHLPQPGQIPKITVAARVRWGVSDKPCKVEWADQLGEYFRDLDFEPAEEAGHFVHYEKPGYANAQIIEFFKDQ